ncbi:hypothetical protein ACXZ9C_11405 [Streptococcus agalactiae]
MASWRRRFVELVAFRCIRRRVAWRELVVVVALVERLVALVAWRGVAWRRRRSAWRRVASCASRGASRGVGVAWRGVASRGVVARRQRGVALAGSAWRGVASASRGVA